MQASGDTERLISALLGLVDRASTRFPTLQAELVKVAERFGDPSAPLFERLRAGLTEALANPAAAGEIFAEFDSWARLMLTAEGRTTEPLALAIQTALAELGRVAADVQSGDTRAGESLEKHLTPILESAGNFIVNALLGDKR